MNLYKKFIVATAFCFITVFSFAQTSAAQTEQPSGLMQVDGKIYVVVAVILVILIGLFIYLFNLDHKLSKLEKGDKPT